MIYLSISFSHIIPTIHAFIPRKNTRIFLPKPVPSWRLPWWNCAARVRPWRKASFPMGKAREFPWETGENLGDFHGRWENPEKRWEMFNEMYIVLMNSINLFGLHNFCCWCFLYKGDPDKVLGLAFVENEQYKNQSDDLDVRHFRETIQWIEWI